jgi:hypothetical protein
MIQRLPADAPPRSRMTNDPHCFDCESADTLVQQESIGPWSNCRTAVGNARCEQYRMPGVPSTPLAYRGLIRLSEEGALESQLQWLRSRDDLPNPPADQVPRDEECEVDPSSIHFYE